MLSDNGSQEPVWSGDVSALEQYVEVYGTKATDTPVDLGEFEVPWKDEGRCGPQGPASEPFEVEMSRSMSMLLVSRDGEALPELGDDGHYVIQCFPSLGVKRTVVERAQNILTLDEANAHQKECNQAMLDELMRWLNLGAFERMPKKGATNVIDARWVLKWKEVNGKRIIQARLVVRGFKDLQAAQPSTFAGTSTRWGQRLVNSTAAQHCWPLLTSDVSQAFLRGLTFEHAA